MWWFVIGACLVVFLMLQFVVFPSSLPIPSEEPFFSPQSKPLVSPQEIVPSDAQLFRAFGGKARPSSPLIAQSAIFLDFISRIDGNSNTFRCNQDDEEEARRIPLSYVNDDVCDCGMDEPGTSACSGHVAAPSPSFACKPIITKSRTRTTGRTTTTITADGAGGLRGSRDMSKKRQKEEDEEEEKEKEEEEEVVTWLPSSRVNDGVQDCCDGADEWKRRVENQTSS